MLARSARVASSSSSFVWQMWRWRIVMVAMMMGDGGGLQRFAVCGLWRWLWWIAVICGGSDIDFSSQPAGKQKNMVVVDGGAEHACEARHL